MIRVFQRQTYRGSGRHWTDKKNYGQEPSLVKIAMTSAVCRVLVHLAARQDTSPQLVRFSQCLVGLCHDQKIEQISSDEKRKDSCPEHTYITCSLKHKSLIVSTSTKETGGVLLKHPPFCPMLEISQDEVNKLPREISERGVDVGVVAILHSKDRRVLLTRRAEHMRTFPNTWVPPGGHIEIGETLIQALSREIAEETGLNIDGCEENLLCAWESVYPYSIRMGQPKRHHLVLYYLIRSEKDHLQLDSEMKLDAGEVGGSCWIDTNLASLITGEGNLGDVNGSISIKSINKKLGVWETVSLPSAVFMAEAPTSGPDIERISTGTRYALKQWLKTLE